MRKTNPATLAIVATKSAPKLGERSEGSVDYHVMIDVEESQVYLAIAGNEGGGYFSREPVAVEAIRDCIRTASPQGFFIRVLRPAFSGRSANNPGFLGAALRAEGLIAPADSPHRYVEAERWDSWVANYLAAGPEEEQRVAASISQGCAGIGEGPEEKRKQGKTGKAGTRQRTYDEGAMFPDAEEKP